MDEELPKFFKIISWDCGWWHHRYFFSEFAIYLEPIGRLFLNMIFVLIVPLVFCGNINDDCDFAL